MAYNILDPNISPLNGHHNRIQQTIVKVRVPHQRAKSLSAFVINLILSSSTNYTFYEIFVQIVHFSKKV